MNLLNTDVFPVPSRIMQVPAFHGSEDDPDRVGFDKTIQEYRRVFAGWIVTMRLCAAIRAVTTRGFVTELHRKIRSTTMLSADQRRDIQRRLIVIPQRRGPKYDDQDAPLRQRYQYVDFHDRYRFERVLNSLDYFDESDVIGVNVVVLSRQRPFVPSVGMSITGNGNAGWRLAHLLFAGLVHLRFVIDQRCELRKIRSLKSPIAIRGMLLELSHRINGFFACTQALEPQNGCDDDSALLDLLRVHDGLCVVHDCLDRLRGSYTEDPVTSSPSIASTAVWPKIAIGQRGAPQEWEDPVTLESYPEELDVTARPTYLLGDKTKTYFKHDTVVKLLRSSKKMCVVHPLTRHEFHITCLRECNRESDCFRLRVNPN